MVAFLLPEQYIKDITYRGNINMLNKQATTVTSLIRGLGAHLPGIVNRSGSAVRLNRNLLKAVYNRGILGKGMINRHGVFAELPVAPSKFNMRFVTKKGYANKTLKQLEKVYAPPGQKLDPKVSSVAPQDSGIRIPGGRDNIINAQLRISPTSPWPITSHELGHWYITNPNKFGNYYKNLYDRQGFSGMPILTLKKWTPTDIFNVLKTEFAAHKYGLKLWPYKTTSSIRHEAINKTSRPSLNTYKQGMLQGLDDIFKYPETADKHLREIADEIRSVTHMRGKAPYEPWAPEGNWNNLNDELQHLIETRNQVKATQSFVTRARKKLIGAYKHEFKDYI